MNDFARFLDTLNKLNAKHKMPGGGEQYTMEVALPVSASAKGQAMMRSKKADPALPMSLRALIKKQS